jgi:glutaconate CoA-transferase subunit B
VILTERAPGIDPFQVPQHTPIPPAPADSHILRHDRLLHTVLNQGYVDVTFLGVGQIDRYGNMNSSYLGEPGNYATRMTGAGGAPEFIGYAGRAILTMSGGTFVEKLDYFTSPGYLDGGDSRYGAGMPEGSGPSVLITTRGVISSTRSRGNVPGGLHPGSPRMKSGGSALGPEDRRPPETKPAPTEEEIAISPHFAPHHQGRSCSSSLRSRYSISFKRSLIPEWRES